MRAAFLVKKKKIEVHKIKDPSPQKGQLVVKMNYVGICGSDLTYYNYGGLGDQSLFDSNLNPVPLGHEPAGTIIESKNPRFKIGDKVAVDPLVSCESLTVKNCEYCLNKSRNLCNHSKYLGPYYQGGFREYIVAYPKQLFVLPKNFDLKIASLLEPLGIALHAINHNFVKSYNNKLINNILIIGAGAIGGFIALSLASIYKNKFIYIYDNLDFRSLYFSNKYKNIKVIKKYELDSIKEFFDCVYDTVLNNETFQKSIDSLKKKGCIVNVGIPNINFLKINPHILRLKEITIYNVRRSNVTLDKIYKFYLKNLNLDNYINQIFDLENIDNAFKENSKYKNKVRKCIIKI